MMKRPPTTRGDSLQRSIPRSHHGKADHVVATIESVKYALSIPAAIATVVCSSWATCPELKFGTASRP